MGTLYIVEMPLPECHDMTLRTRRILEQVSAVTVLPQDIQTARRRLGECNILSKSVEPYDQVSVLAQLQDGDVAFLAHTCSEIDAPIRSLIKQNVHIVPIPGPVSQVTALVMSGLPTERFIYLGFLPSSRSELLTMWHSIARESYTLVCNALAKDLGDVFDTCKSVLGERYVAVYQVGSVWRGSTSRVPAGLGGTVTLAIEGVVEQTEVWPEEKIRAAVRAGLETGTSLRDVAQEIAARSGWKRRRVYAIAMEVKADQRPDGLDY